MKQPKHFMIEPKKRTQNLKMTDSLALYKKTEALDAPVFYVDFYNYSLPSNSILKCHSCLIQTLASSRLFFLLILDSPE